MSYPQPSMRKTRFVCISDTHNGTPNGAFKLPKGDVLIHAGDLTNQGSYPELKKTMKWIEEAEFEAKIVVAGNHDITLDSEFYSQHGLYFHNQQPQKPSECQELLDNAPSILWLKHEEAIIDLQSPTGPRTTFKIFGSPYSPANGMWAFGYNPDEAAFLWEQIPLDADIVVTHTPPKYRCDERKNRRAVGCDALRQALWRVRPRLAICGHVHESRGAERIRWDLGASNVKYKENGVVLWEDPGRGNNKLSLIDLTSKGRNPLDNDGSVSNLTDSGTFQGPRASLPIQSLAPKFPMDGQGASLEPEANSEPGLAMIDPLVVPAKSLSRACWGQGGFPPSRRCDLEALSGRMGRRETCIINASIMASSWPHASGGGKKFNKPIVVDIDLPVWEK